jgi:hypothetical protein
VFSVKLFTDLRYSRCALMPNPRAGFASANSN